MGDGRPLAGLRVVDQADDRGALCGRLLADLGADVVRVEPPTGAPTRALGPFVGPHSLHHAVRNTGKTGCALDVSTEPAGRRICSPCSSGPTCGSRPRRPAVARRFAVRARGGGHPLPAADRHLDHRLRPHRALPRPRGDGRDARRAGLDPAPGRLGRRAAAPAARARSPATSPRSPRPSPPSSPSAPPADGRGPGARRLGARGRGGARPTGASPSYSVLGPQGRYHEVRDGSGQVNPMLPCADGWIRLCINTQAEWGRILTWMREPVDLLDHDFESATGRAPRWDDLIFASAAPPPRRAVDAAGDRGGAGAPCAAHPRPRTSPGPGRRALHHPPGSFVDAEIVAGRAGPDPERLLDHRRRRPGRAGPGAGARGAATPVDAIWRDDRPAVAPTHGASDGGSPFRGLLVLDFGVAGAAPELGRMLAEYGAEVLRIEDPDHPEVFRLMGGAAGIGPMFTSSNRSKRSLGLRLTRPGGRRPRPPARPPRRRRHREPGARRARPPRDRLRRAAAGEPGADHVLQPDDGDGRRVERLAGVRRERRRPSPG